jgi:hypothetical protein
LAQVRSFKVNLARPWILPVVIFSGLSATYAIPWNFTNIDGYFIFSTVVPLLAQAILCGVSSVLAFMGKEAWWPIQITTTVIASINSIGFLVAIWGVRLPGLPLTLLILSTIGLYPALIWGRKKLEREETAPISQSQTETKDW